MKNFLSLSNKFKDYSSTPRKYLKENARLFYTSAGSGFLFGICVFLKMIGWNRAIIFTQDMFVLLFYSIFIFTLLGLIFGIFLCLFTNSLRIIKIKLSINLLSIFTITVPTFFLFWFFFSKFAYVGMYYHDFPNILQNKWVMASLWILRLLSLLILSWIATVFVFQLYFLFRKLKRPTVLLLIIVLIPLFMLIFDYYSYSSKNKAKTSPFSAVQAKSKVIFIGIDGAEWKIIDALIEKNLLPNFKQLKEQGSYGRLKTINYESPGIWTSMVTGVTPRNHGIFKHTQFKFHGMKDYIQAPYYLGINSFIPKIFKCIGLRLFKITLISSNKREVPALWNILSLKNRKNITPKDYINRQSRRLRLLSGLPPVHKETITQVSRLSLLSRQRQDKSQNLRRFRPPCRTCARRTRRTRLHRKKPLPD